MPNRSRNLLKKWISNFYYQPLTWVPIACLLLLFIFQIDTTKFGQEHLTPMTLYWWGFSPLDLTKSYGLPWFFSFLAHQDLSHFLVNLPFFLWFAYQTNRVYPTWFINLLLFIMNIFINAAIWMSHLFHFHLTDNSMFMGLSGVCLALFAFLSVRVIRKYLLAVAFLMIYFFTQLWQPAQPVIEVFAHLISLIIGLTFGLALYKWPRHSTSPNPHPHQ